MIPMTTARTDPGLLPGSIANFELGIESGLQDNTGLDDRVVELD
jgi:hypothetical protein